MNNFVLLCVGVCVRMCDAQIVLVAGDFCFRLLLFQSTVLFYFIFLQLVDK